ncbi:MAG: orotate phosphoribosyltransferase [Candidatus Doudnabacteria bacterium]|nr:orotate phosphoribosyltransferase [Candidatus Doudnabacteria bacterium]
MNNEVIEILKQTGALLTGHFVGTSGRHIDTYVNKDALYMHPKQASRICRLMAEEAKSFDVDVVVGPALGGIVLSQWTAYHLSEIKNKDILAIYTEKTPEGGQKFMRGYDKVVKLQNVLIVEDAPTTGISAKKVVDAVIAAGGKVVAVSVMVNKDPKNVNSEFFGAPFLPLIEFEIQSYEDADCLLCKKNIPINTTVGHGKKYLEMKNARGQ